MSSVCGIINLRANSSDGVEFEALRRMWCASAPLGRGYTYLRNGIALACDNDPRASATLPSPTRRAKGENCTVMLCGIPPSPFFAKEILEKYFLFGTESLCEAKEPFSFAFLDEKERLLVLSSANTPLFCARAAEKILFSSDKKAIGAYFSASSLMPMQPIMLECGGFALFCDISAQE